MQYMEASNSINEISVCDVYSSELILQQNQNSEVERLGDMMALLAQMKLDSLSSPKMWGTL